MCAIHQWKLLSKPTKMWIYTHFLSLCSMLRIVFLSHTFLKSIHNCIPFPLLLKSEPTFSSTQLGQQEGKGKRKKRKERECMCMCLCVPMCAYTNMWWGGHRDYLTCAFLPRKEVFPCGPFVRTQCLHDVRGHSTSSNLIPNGRDMSFCKVIPLRKEKKKKPCIAVFFPLPFLYTNCQVQKKIIA